MSIDIGPGEVWAQRRGADEPVRRLNRYMGNLITAEFLLSVQGLEETLPAGLARDRLRCEFELLKTLPPRVTRQVLTHPVWIYWARSVQHYLDAHRNATPVAPFWRGHIPASASTPHMCLQAALSHFSQLVLAACVLAGRQVELVLPLGESDRYVALAGTGISYPLQELERSASRPLIASVIPAGGQHFRIRIKGAGSPAAEFGYMLHDDRIEQTGTDRYWLARIDAGPYSFEVDNHDSRFVDNWISSRIHQQATGIGPAHDSELPIWRARLTSALDMLKACCSPLNEELLAILRVIVPVTSATPNYSISCSAREYWGAIQCSLHPGIAMADVLAHEYRHNILNAILEVDPVIDEATSDGLLLYSPWRLDPRPPIALLHGIYAFMEVAGFYASYLETFGCEAPQAELARKHLQMNIDRLQQATATLTQNVSLTVFGAELLHGIQCRIDRMARDHPCSDPDLAVLVRDSMRQHYETWQVRSVGSGFEND